MKIERNQIVRRKSSLVSDMAKGLAEKFLLVVVSGSLVLGAVACGKKEDVPPAAATDSLVVPNRAGVFTEATEFYGPLTVTEGEFFAQAEQRPWSAYWFPLKDNILVTGSSRNGGVAPLDKYDKYAKSVFGKNATSVQEEIAKHLYYPLAENWEGRCGAWAIASVMEPEPALPTAGVRIPGTDPTFFTRDVKALMIKSYETVDNSAFHRFGQPYTGEQGNDYQDVYPDQFHRVLQAELFEKQRAFIMDDTSGVEVWNTPVWQALITITKDASDSHIMHVFARIKGAQSVRISPDYSGPSNDTTYQYNYDLVGMPQADGSLQVKYGTWTGESIQDHPDYVLTLPAKGVKIRHASENKQLDADVINDIMTKTRAQTQ